MNKLEDNKKKKRDALLNTAFELFTTKGLQKTTISDIVQKAGVAKGTFYLYFSDKYDVRNELVSHKAAKLFYDAHEALSHTQLSNFEDQLIFIADYIINQLVENQALLRFIARNLSWGVFRKAIDVKVSDEEYNVYKVYYEMVANSPKNYENPELMLFTIVELMGGTCYSCILYNDPVPIEEYKPFLYRTIKGILNDYAKEAEA